MRSKASGPAFHRAFSPCDAAFLVVRRWRNETSCLSMLTAIPLTIVIVSEIMGGLDPGVRPEHWLVAAGKSSGNVGADRQTSWFHAVAPMVVEGRSGCRVQRRAAGIRRSSCGSSTEKPDPGDVDGYWVEPDEGVYDRIDPYWIDFELILVPHLRKWKWRMWADHGVEFFVHPAMQPSAEMAFPSFFAKIEVLYHAV